MNPWILLFFLNGLSNVPMSTLLIILTKGAAGDAYAKGASGDAYARGGAGDTFAKSGGRA